MALTQEQVKALKEQLVQQIQHLPESKKSLALQQIEALSPEALESMLKQQQRSHGKEKSVFRMIVDREIPSALVDENASAIAVLDINPISRGHTIIIPRLAAKDAKDLPTQAFTLAKKLSKKIISKLKAKSAEIQTENKFGEVIINIIPIYDIPLNVNSERQKISKEEIEKIAGKLKPKKRVKKEKIIRKEEKLAKTEALKLPRKIP
jgi:histidine triad (HIT) family protein